MMKTSGLKWLVLDDSEDDLDRFQTRLESAGQEVLRASTTDEAREILRTKDVHVCLFDFYIGGADKTSVKLIAALRKYYRSIPIILCSSAKMDGVSIEDFIAAGADIILPKAWDDKSFRTVLVNAGLATFQSYKSRNRISLEVKAADAKLYIAKTVRKKLNVSKRGISGVTLIYGDRNTGKTLLARKLAQVIKDTAAGSLSTQIREFDCAHMSEDELKANLFEDGDVDSFAQINVFEAAHGGIVILDNIHAMSQKMRAKLRRIFEEDEFIAPDGRKVSVSDTKFIFTYRAGSEPMLRGLIEVFDAEEIALPSVDELGEEFRDCVSFFVDVEIKRRNWPKLTVHDDYFDELHAFVKRGTKDNYITLTALIEDSVQQAIAAGRHNLFETDLSLPRVEAAAESAGGLDSRTEFGKTVTALLALVRKGADLKRIQQLAARAALVQSIVRFRCNPVAAATALKISKVHLYRLGYLKLLKKVESEP